MTDYNPDHDGASHPDPPQVGWWYFRCCNHCLYPIDTEQDLADLQDEVAEQLAQTDGWWPMPRFWPTREQALAEIRRVNLYLP